MRRMRIGTAGTLIALAALDLTLLREMPASFLLVPFIAILVVSLNLACVRLLALRKPLHASHMGFIGAGLLFGLGTLGLRTRIVATLVASYRWATGDTAIRWFDGTNQLMLAEQGVMLALGLLSCLAGGVLVSYGVAGYGARSRVEPVTPRL